MSTTFYNINAETGEDKSFEGLKTKMGLHSESGTLAWANKRATFDNQFNIFISRLFRLITFGLCPKSITDA